MKKKKLFLTSLILFAVFIVFTILVAFVDVKAIGVEGTGKKAEVGFATLNGAYKDAIGYTEILYKITDWGSILAIITGFIFFFVGIKQWIKRKNILKVDASIIILGITYIILLGVYLFFEKVLIVDYRPVLVDGGKVPETGYPSSTTLLAIGFMVASMYQTHRLLKDKKIVKIIDIISIIYISFLVIGRLLSGVHWLTDIIGSLMLSSCVSTLYLATAMHFDEKQNNSVKALE